ncbi:hypothetical protein AX27061_0355 [Achromobacter xylosoxidans NBRC 15126 = ATCC 27061]|nr:hypothetical protein AX27061_0355 [Achromobacter xylosoxidans NBRC 15126 = ATCC 27061]
MNLSVGDGEKDSIAAPNGPMMIRQQAATDGRPPSGAPTAKLHRA